MAKLSLSLAFAPNPRSMPILDGTVEAEGIELTCSRVSPGEQFHRQLTHQEFDVSEMSISSLLMITAAGDTNWVALPIFTTRYFFGTTAIARNGAGIDALIEPLEALAPSTGPPPNAPGTPTFRTGLSDADLGLSPEERGEFE